MYNQAINTLLIEIFNFFYHNPGNNLKELLVISQSVINGQSKSELMITLVNSVLRGKRTLRYFGSVIP